MQDSCDVSKRRSWTIPSKQSAFVVKPKTPNLNVGVRSSGEPNPILVCTAGLGLITIQKDSSSQGISPGNIEINNQNSLLMKRYQLLQIIGQGTFSVLWSAEDKYRNMNQVKNNTPVYKKVAIKMMFPEYSDYGKQEALRLYHLNSLDRDDLSGIVKIYNTFYHQGHFCIVMELLDISLEKLTQKRVKFSLSDIREVGHQILSTVDFLHKNNYIHADLKPENILLAYENGSQRMKVKLVDFGNAFKEDEIYAYSYDNNYELQSLEYRAPEVLLGLQIQNRMDLWSVGCIFAEMVNGKLLFEIPIENPLHNSETITNSEQVMGSGTSRCDIVKMLRAIVEILGPLPLPLYSSALFYQQLVQDKQLLDFQNDKITNSTSFSVPLETKNNKLFTSYDNTFLGDCLRYMTTQNILRQRLQLGHTEEAQLFLDLLLCLLEYNPSKRFTAEEALSHPFFAKVSDVARFSCRGGLSAYNTKRNRIYSLYNQKSLFDNNSFGQKPQTKEPSLFDIDIFNPIQETNNDPVFSSSKETQKSTFAHQMGTPSSKNDTTFQNSQLCSELVDESVSDNVSTISDYATNNDSTSITDNDEMAQASIQNTTKSSVGNLTNNISHSGTTHYDGNDTTLQRKLNNKKTISSPLHYKRFHYHVQLSRLKRTLRNTTSKRNIKHQSQSSTSQSPKTRENVSILLKRKLSSKQKHPHKKRKKSNHNTTLYNAILTKK